MYTIELVRGAAWDAPIVMTHIVTGTIHVVDVERRAMRLLRAAQHDSTQPPTNFRVVDRYGNCVRASANDAPSKTLMWRAGRTCWAV